MNPHRKLIKRWRVDEIRAATGETVGIYVDPDRGAFYARVPEEEGGTWHDADTKHELERKVKAAADDYYSLAWRPMIRVVYAHSMRYHANRRGWAQGNGCRWNPDDPESASDVVGPLTVTTLEVAMKASGERWIRDWSPEWEKDHPAWASRRPEKDTDRDIVDLPYRAETLAAVQDFQRRIRGLDHQIRLLLRQPDLEACLLFAAGRLLTVGTNDPEVTP